MIVATMVATARSEPASRATTYSYAQIVFAAGLGALCFGERPDALSAAGGALVLLGAWLASLGRRD